MFSVNSWGLIGKYIDFLELDHRGAFNPSSNEETVGKLNETSSKTLYLCVRCRYNFAKQSTT